MKLAFIPLLLAGTLATSCSTNGVKDVIAPTAASVAANSGSTGGGGTPTPTSTTPFVLGPVVPVPANFLDLLTASSWKLSTYIKAGKDKTSTFPGMVMTFNPLIGLVSWGDFSVSGPNVAGGLWHWGGVSYYGVFDGGVTTLQLSMGNLAVMRPLSIVWSIREASATTLVLDNGNGLEDTHLVFHH
jgi:hypothetical protein